jgi:hypothetical protein
MNRKKIGLIIAIGAVLIGGIFYFSKSKKTSTVKQIQINGTPEVATGPLNQGDVSPITGIACENWNKRTIAVMQPSDVQARPAAGFSEADMVIEMPAFTNSVTRLMGIYGCTIPKEIGAIRSARHDYLPIASGLNSVFVHWGYSKFAETLLEKKIINNINCLTTSFCERWQPTGKMRMEDTGFISSEKIVQAMKQYGYSTENTFSGYLHQAETPLENRPAAGHLRVAFANPYDADYTYDKETNSYLRSWNGQPDVDKNNQKRVAPKNVVVMVAKSEQIKLSSNFPSRGVQDPWDLVPKEEQEGLDYGGVGRYNNMEIGDPWFDTADSGDATFYFNGIETKGSWKKDRSKIDSKLNFFDSNGKEIQFVPGQIWVDIAEPGNIVRWSTGA